MKRILSLILSVVMLFSLVPAEAFADDEVVIWEEGVEAEEPIYVEPDSAPEQEAQQDSSEPVSPEWVYEVDERPKTLIEQIF